MLQLSASRPQSRVTFGGAQLRTCSNSSGSAGSSTSGSCCSRQCNVFPNGEARRTRGSSLSKVEDFQETYFPLSRSKNSVGSSMDPDALGSCKKAKIVQDLSIRDETPFVHSAGKRSQSFASVEGSLMETEADEYHFWSKMSSSCYEDSFVGLGENDVESPLSRTAAERPGCVRLSFSKSYNEPTSSQQADLNHAKRDLAPNEDYVQHRGDVQHKANVGAFGLRTPASNLQSSVIHQELATGVQTVTSDARSQRTEDADKEVVITRSNKWWAFVSGIRSELSPPG